MLLYMSAVQPFPLLHSIPLHTNAWAPVSRCLLLCISSVDRKSGFTDLNSETGVGIRPSPRSSPWHPLFQWFWWAGWREALCKLDGETRIVGIQNTEESKGWSPLFSDLVPRAKLETPCRVSHVLVKKCLLIAKAWSYAHVFFWKSCSALPFLFRSESPQYLIILDNGRDQHIHARSW